MVFWRDAPDGANSVEITWIVPGAGNRGDPQLP